MDDVPLPPLPARPTNAHKGSMGRVLVVGGSLGMSGAPTLAARGALRAGAGLVTIAVPSRIQDVVANLLPEALTIGLPCDEDGCLTPAAGEAVKARLDRVDAIVIGPGLGRTPGTEQAVLRIVAAAAMPLLLDADGLYVFRMRLSDLARRTAPTVLTPHEREAAGLLGEDADTEHSERASRAIRIAVGVKGVCVLKGPGTIVTDGARTRTNSTGGPVLASGGTGDVLGGAIAAFLAGLPATGGDPFGAACLGAHVHGAAGDRLAAARGDRGVLASEVADALPEAIRDLVSGAAPEMNASRATIGALLATLAFARAAPADPARSPYAPAPEGLVALVATPAEDEAATRAAAAILSPRPDTARDARNDLLAAGNAGLRTAAEKLAAGAGPGGTVSDSAELLLLQVIAASPRREVDEVLLRAAKRPRFETRAVAAFGLGAGRTPAAVEALAILARDEVPAVRSVALRALFASEAPAARAARLALPVGEDERVLALRLRLHRLRGDEGDEVGRIALHAWRFGRAPLLRVEAARCLSLAACRAPSALLRWIVVECGEQESVSRLSARFLVAARHDYPPGEARLAAAEALVALLGRPDVDAPLKEALVATGVRWIGRTISLKGHQVDLEACLLLRATLPDVGAALVPPVVARLRANAFFVPSDGTTLLVSLPDEIALPALRGLADPRGGAIEPVRLAATASLSRIGRIGDAEVARALLAPEEPTGIRQDATVALRGDDAAFALPLLSSAAKEPTVEIASHAATTLLGRAEPAARTALEDVLLHRKWDRYMDGLLASVVAGATDADWRLLERMLLEGSPEARAAVFDRLADGASKLRGPRAIALVRLARERPALGIGIVTVARALVHVDPEASVPFIREMSEKVSRDGRNAMLRDLQVTRLPEAAAYALEVAAKTPDDDAAMLGAVVTVLTGACPKDPTSFDPFWRRVIKGPHDGLRQKVLEELATLPHGPMADLALPILRDPDADPDVRRAALPIVVQEALAENVDLLWSIASHRIEDEDLRTAAARALLAVANPAIRTKALARLEEPVEDSVTPTTQIALLAGTGASPAEAARLLALLDATIARHYASAPPYYVPLAADDPYAWRGPFLCDALGASGDATSLDALAARLFDPRFAAWSEEARRARWLGEAAASGPLGALEDPPTLASLLHLPEDGVQKTPVPPVPPEAAWLVDALRRAGPSSAPDRVGKAIEDARASGRLARTSDAYVACVARGLRAPAGPRPGNALPDAAAAADRALAHTFPADGAEELDAADVLARTLAGAGRYAEAADAQAAALRLAARLGLADLPASIWIERYGATSPPSWAKRKAGEDLLRGAAAAVAGKAGEARDAFRRGEARVPLDAPTLQDAAFLRATTGVEPEVAEALVRRALALLERAEDRHVRAYLRTLALTLSKQGKADEARRVLDEAEATPDAD